MKKRIPACKITNLIQSAYQHTKTHAIMQKFTSEWENAHQHANIQNSYQHTKIYTIMQKRIAAFKKHNSMHKTHNSMHKTHNSMYKNKCFRRRSRRGEKLHIYRTETCRNHNKLDIWFAAAKSILPD